MDDRAALFAGIDLGTTNSAAAVFDGNEVHIVRNTAGSALTPSVVRMDRRGRATVGVWAARFADRDPDNTRREFKRLMGTTHALTFAASGQTRLPEELSALVLETLRQDIADLTGAAPTRAVISVPALFELPQSRATARAAELAGFEHIELLQEPIASALAAGWRDDDIGSWLVYDLGGGTFDVSLLETRDGLLRVVGHDGDNFLGGRDFDHAIVDWAIEQLRARGVRLERRNRAHAGALALLRRAAENTKIELSRTERAELVLDEPLAVDGTEIDVELELDRATLERISAPLLQRSLEVCHRLLATHGLQRDQLSRVVLVGGPSVMPMVRHGVERALGAEIATGHDPMTLVAQGAALYAATVGLDGRATAVREPAAGVQRLWCQYPMVSADLEPHVIGRFSTPTEVAAVELIRLGPGGEPTWRSAPMPLDEQAAFVTSVRLVPRQVSRFAIAATSASGQPVATEPAELSIVQGLSVGDPPLGRTIGVALANNSVHTYFQRGTSLPARRTFTHYTVEAVTAGSTERIIDIPIVQGEFESANLCLLVGSLSISGRDVARTIPSGAAVEVTLCVKRGGELSASARIGGADDAVLEFEHVAQLVVPDATPASLTGSIEAVRERLAGLQGAAFRFAETDAIGRLQRLDAQLAAAEALVDALTGGDLDAGQRATRIVLDVDAAVTELEAERRWPEFEAEAADTHSWASVLVATHGRDTEQRLLEKAGTALERALERRSVADATRQLRVIRRLGEVSFWRDPEAAQRVFAYQAGNIEETTDLRRAQKLVNQGRKAIERNDTAALRAIVQQLEALFVADPTTRRMSYDSGVL